MRNKGKTMKCHSELRKLRHVWYQMIYRCYNPKSQHFDRYGAEGIEVCDRWRESLEHFLADMGPRPIGHVVDRIDKTQGFSPDNCAWATRKTQQRHARHVHLVTFDGQKYCINEWAERTGLPRLIIQDRLKDGWSVEDALTTPVRQSKPRQKAA